MKNDPIKILLKNLKQQPSKRLLPGSGETDHRLHLYSSPPLSYCQSRIQRVVVSGRGEKTLET